MALYQVCVQIDRRWVRVRQMVAGSHSAALRAAIGLLDPAHYDKPIRVERVDGDDDRDGDWAVKAASAAGQRPN